VFVLLLVDCSWQPEDKKAGSSESDTYVLNNHLRFKIKYHPVDTDGVMTEGNPDGYPFFLFPPIFPSKIKYHHVDTDGVMTEDTHIRNIYTHTHLRNICTCTCTHTDACTPSNLVCS